MKSSARMLSLGIMVVLLSEVVLVGFGSVLASPNPNCNTPGVRLVANPAVRHLGRPICTNNPIFLRPGSSGDPQYGYSTTSSAGAYGISDEQTAVQTLLTASPNIGIGAALYDDFTLTNGTSDPIWYHIGIGNNLNANGVNSGCSSAPVIWGEYESSGNGYTQLALACASYGSTYTLSIVEDNTNGQYCWAYYVGSTWYDQLCLYEETNIGTSGSWNFIEATSTPAFGSSDTSWTVYGNGLQYTTSPTTSHGISSLSWTNPAITQFNPSNAWTTTYWSESHSGSSPWSFTYTWDCSGGSCP